jgi:hypothetical protein
MTASFVLSRVLPDGVPVDLRARDDLRAVAREHGRATSVHFMVHDLDDPERGELDWPHVAELARSRSDDDLAMVLVGRSGGEDRQRERVLRKALMASSLQVSELAASVAARATGEPPSDDFFRHVESLLVDVVWEAVASARVPSRAEWEAGREFDLGGSAA